MATPLPFEPAPPAGSGAIALLLEEAPQLVQPLIDAMPARVIVLDADECLVYANHEFFAFTRLQPQQVLGRPIAQIIGPETHASYAPAREKLRRGEGVCWEAWTDLAGQGPRYMREHLIPVGRPHRATIAIS